MKLICLWDARFPDRAPSQLLVEDSLASAAVRAGVAAAVDPAEAGALMAGGALDPGLVSEVTLQHGPNNAIRRVFLPYSVIAIGITAGVLALVGHSPEPPPDAIQNNDGGFVLNDQGGYVLLGE